MKARKAAQRDWAGAFLASKTKGLGRGVHRLFRTIAREVNKETPEMGEQGSEVAPFLPEPRNFAEVTRLPAEVKKPWLRATLKEVKNLIDNQTFCN